MRPRRPRDRDRSKRTLLAAAAGSLVLAGSAQAADFYVAAGGTGTGASGCVAAAPCAEVQQAIVARNTSADTGPGTIHVGAGTFAPFNLSGVGAPLTVEGASIDGTRISGTIPGGSSAQVDLTGDSELKLRRLTVLAPASFTGIAVYAQRGTLTIEDAAVTEDGAGNTYAVASNPSGTVVVRRSTIVSHANEHAMFMTGPATVEDSSVLLDAEPNNMKFVGAFAAAGGGAKRIVRSTITRTNSGSQAGHAIAVPLSNGNGTPSITVDSSIIRGGGSPLGFAIQGGQTVPITLQNATVDARKADPAVIPYIALSQNGGAMQLTADSSILLGSMPTGAFYGASCTYTDVSSAQGNNGTTNDCVGNEPTNTSTGAVFAPGTYAPTSTAGVVDTGNPNVPAGFSPTDFARQPRLLSSTGGCPGLRDRGAVEYAGNPGVAPVVSIDGPTTQTGAVPGAFSTVTGDAVTSAWSTDDGASGSGPSFSHAFTTEGTHVVTLVATKAGGCTSTATRVVTVTGLTPANPGGGGGGAAGGGGAGAAGGTGQTGTGQTGTGTGQPGKGATGQNGAAKDTTAPKVTLTSLTRKRLVLRADEPAAVTVKLCAPVGKAAARKAKRAARKAKPVCRTVKGSGTGKIKIALKLSAKGRYTVTIKASDTAGNKAAAVKTRVSVR